MSVLHLAAAQNLNRQALGSSAPEILLSVVETLNKEIQWVKMRIKGTFTIPITDPWDYMVYQGGDYPWGILE